MTNLPSGPPHQPSGPPLGTIDPLDPLDPDDPGTISIDCATCVMRNTATCDDCVVTFLCEREPTDAVLLDLSEVQALRRLAQAGLAPGLRHTQR
jgi:hypothetical protein